MSAAVPSGRRITGGLLKGYFIRTSSSYPAYPREFPAGVRKSSRRSLRVPQTRLSPCDTPAENSRRRGTRVRVTFHPSDSRKVRARARRYLREKPHLLRASYTNDGILRNGNPIPRAPIYFPRDGGTISFQTRI